MGSVGRSHGLTGQFGLKFRWHHFLFSGNAPNYYPNSFSGPVDNTAKLECPIHISGDVQRYNTADDDNFTQVGTFWNKVGDLQEQGRGTFWNRVGGLLEQGRGPSGTR